jgi:hypothetical protein
MPQTLRISALAGAFLLAAIPASQAESIGLVAHLLGGNAVPATKSDAFGEAQFTYDTATRQLEYYVTYDGATPTRIDLHGPAGTTENAAAIATFPLSESPLTGKVTLSPDQGAALLAGHIYIDIHSQAYANGEIRGQIGKQEH